MGGTLHFTLRRQPQYFTVSEASRFIRAQHIFIGVLSTCRKPLDCWDMGSKGGVSENVPGTRFPADPARPQTCEPIRLRPPENAVFSGGVLLCPASAACAHAFLQKNGGGRRTGFQTRGRFFVRSCAKTKEPSPCLPLVFLVPCL